MGVSVIGSGVLIRLATDDEARAVEDARRGRGFVLERSFRLTKPDRPLAPKVYVVGQAFVDFVTDVEQRWTAAEHLMASRSAPRATRRSSCSRSLTRSEATA